MFTQRKDNDKIDIKIIDDGGSKMAHIQFINCLNCNFNHSLNENEIKGIHTIHNGSVYMYFHCPNCNKVCHCCKEKGEEQYHVFNTLTDISNETDLTLFTNHSGLTACLFYKGYRIEFSHDRDTWVEEISVGKMDKTGNGFYKDCFNGNTKLDLLESAIKFIEQQINECK